MPPKPATTLAGKVFVTYLKYLPRYKIAPSPRLAPETMPDTPDCTIIIPLHQGDPVDSSPQATFRLHAECLSAKSIFLRGLLAGVSPIDLIRDLASSRLRPSVPLRIHKSRLPCLLPSPPSHPVLFLPVPDPSSIQSLFHWMYSGNTDHIEHALDQGLVQWEGLARNVEYLCLSTEIKVFLGHWYRSWFIPSKCKHHTPHMADDDPSDLDSEWDDECYSHSSPSTDGSDDEECDRGRTRDVKPLEQLCGKLRLCTI